MPRVLSKGKDTKVGSGKDDNLENSEEGPKDSDDFFARVVSIYASRAN